MSGKTYTLMGPDGVTAGVVDRCFKRIMQDTKHDYKVSNCSPRSFFWCEGDFMRVVLEYIPPLPWTGSFKELGG